MPFKCREPNEAEDGHFVDDGAGNYLGECVSLVKRLCREAMMPPTSQWKRGELVKGNKTIKQGTAIATFKENGKFHGHAAVYIGQDEKGIQVWDQYNDRPKPVGQRTLDFDDKKSASNNGNKFYIIEVESQPSAKDNK